MTHTVQCQTSEKKVPVSYIEDLENGFYRITQHSQAELVGTIVAVVGYSRETRRAVSLSNLSATWSGGNSQLYLEPLPAGTEIKIVISE